jgi:GNAT superfamily N-acetyltransferase
VIQTRGYTPADAADFLTLYRACLEHYNVPPASSEQENRILSYLHDQRHLSCLMAFNDDVPVGFATWALTFPAGSDFALYMKELFVVEATRGLGVGRALLVELVRIADAEGCCRFDWQTDMGNAISQAFYEKVQAPRFEKVTYRVMSEDYAAFRARLGG